MHERSIHNKAFHDLNAKKNEYFDLLLKIKKSKITVLNRYLKGETI